RSHLPTCLCHGGGGSAMPRRDLASRRSLLASRSRRRCLALKTPSHSKHMCGICFVGSIVSRCSSHSTCGLTTTSYATPLRSCGVWRTEPCLAMVRGRRNELKHFDTGSSQEPRRKVCICRQVAGGS